MQQVTEQEPVATNLKLDADVRAELERQAKDNERSLTGQVQWLIKQEAERRGITPKNNDADSDAA